MQFPLNNDSLSSRVCLAKDGQVLRSFTASNGMFLRDKPGGNATLSLHTREGKAHIERLSVLSLRSAWEA